MKSIEVYTQKELKHAKEENYNEIIVKGKLADNLRKASKITKLSKRGLGVLTGTLGAATVAAPVTGGISYAAATSVAAVTGLEIAAIITASALGISLVIALFKGYEEISFKEGKMVLRKKQ